MSKVRAEVNMLDSAGKNPPLDLTN